MKKIIAFLFILGLISGLIIKHEPVKAADTDTISFYANYKQSDARKMERFNNKRDAWKQVPYSTPTREEFNRGGQKKNQNQQNEEQKKKKK